MLKQLSLSEYLRLSENSKRVAVYREFVCDDLTPYVCLEAIRDKGKSCALLESAILDTEVGQYSLIAFDPVASFCAAADPQKPILSLLREQIMHMRCSEDPQLAPLVGGAVGFISYDAVRQFEIISDRHAKAKIPDFYFDFYRMFISFDHMKKTMTISYVIDNAGPEKSYHDAMQEIVELKKRLSEPSLRLHKSTAVIGKLQEEMDDQQFIEKVKLAKEYIKAGDAFQIVLSRSFKKPYSGSLFDVYRALRMTNAAPFMFYIQTPDFAVAGASPERLVQLKQGKIQTMPIAGTRARCEDQDELIANELLADPKEDAEHMMLVDLGRNDLGSVAEAGSVCVKKLKNVRHFAHVTHLVSIIEANLKKGCDALDVLKAAFPAGTLSGAPKIRAMQIIDELEESKRGLYGGAICTIDGLGQMDSCIAIRMAVLQDGMITVRSGAGIVFDSDPEKEAQETRQKAKGVLDAIKMVEEKVL